MANPNDFYKYFHMEDTDTLLIGKGPQFLHSVVVNSISGGSVIVYDGLDATGTVVLNIPVESGVGTYVYDVRLNTGLYVVTADECDITITTL